MKSYDEVNGKLVEIPPGEGGSYEVREVDGEQVRVRTFKRGEPHAEGECARHADGEPVLQPPEEGAPALTPELEQKGV